MLDLVAENGAGYVCMILFFSLIVLDLVIFYSTKFMKISWNASANFMSK